MQLHLVVFQVDDFDVGCFFYHFAKMRQCEKVVAAEVHSLQVRQVMLDGLHYTIHNSFFEKVGLDGGSSKRGI